eukprot:TRINITY_DN12059_c0_g1_i1.p1 TRINITY_DN12059_c0_g1~~TRINITY_DN12059_c0_g1_i1.p1  ORF type:complete len:733 (+),score=99.62 TRINITY_DN12059_c0_g1_i1:109-2307(+)
MESLASNVTARSPVGRLWNGKIGGDVFCAPAGMVAIMLGVEARLVRGVLCGYVNPIEGSKDSIVSLLDIAVLGNVGVKEAREWIASAHRAVEFARKDPTATLSIRKHKSAALDLVELCENWTVGTPLPAGISSAADKVRKTLHSAAKHLPKSHSSLLWHPLPLFMKLLGRPKCLGIDPPLSLLPLSLISLALPLSPPNTSRTPLTEDEAATKIQATYKGGADRAKVRSMRPDTARGAPDTARGVPDTARGAPNTARSMPVTPAPTPLLNLSTISIPATSAAPVTPSFSVHSQCVIAYQRRLGSPSLSRPSSRVASVSPTHTQQHDLPNLEPGSPFLIGSPAERSSSPYQATTSVTPPRIGNDKPPSKCYSPARPVKREKSLESRVMELLQSGERLHEEIRRGRTESMKPSAVGSPKESNVGTLPGTPKFRAIPAPAPTPVMAATPVQGSMAAIHGQSSMTATRTTAYYPQLQQPQSVVVYRSSDTSLFNPMVGVSRPLRATEVGASVWNPPARTGMNDSNRSLIVPLQQSCLTNRPFGEKMEKKYSQSRTPSLVSEPIQTTLPGRKGSARSSAVASVLGSSTSTAVTSKKPSTRKTRSVSATTSTTTLSSGSETPTVSQSSTPKGGASSVNTAAFGAKVFSSPGSVFSGHDDPCHTLRGRARPRPTSPTLRNAATMRPATTMPQIKQTPSFKNFFNRPRPSIASAPNEASTPTPSTPPTPRAPGVPMLGIRK